MSGPERQPVGVILAGGRGRRLGGDKALVSLAGQALILRPLAAMQAVLTDVAVVAKPDTALPALAGIPVWSEAAEPSHPLVGIVHALALAGGRAVLVCPADLPFVTAASLRALAGADAGTAPAVIAAVDGVAQPLLGRYEPGCAALLEPLAREGRVAMRAAVAQLGARQFELDALELFNVNTPEDLRRAEARVRGQPNVKS
ncbi:MAG: molybdenum cofactor guanylyltransferase [Solirubrobacteraceae bacterium]